MQDAGDDTGDNAWCTYGELAKARNIERRAAVRLAQRRRWRRQAGNDGLARVLVPRDWLKPADRTRDIAGDMTADDAGDVAPVVAPAPSDAVAAFQAALTMLAEQLARERDRGDVATVEVATLREQIATLQADLATAQEAADRHFAELQATQMALGEAAADAAELRLANEATENQRNRADRAEADAERTRADALRAQLAGLEAKLQDLESEGAASDVRAAEMAMELKQARAEAQAATQVTAELRKAEAERAGQGRWRRIREAWRGR